MNQQPNAPLLQQKKQELIHLKQQAKELGRKVERRQYEYNHHYNLTIAGVVLTLLFIETNGLTVFLAFFGIALFLAGVGLFVNHAVSKAPRQLKEAEEKIVQLKCEIVELTIL